VDSDCDGSTVDECLDTDGDLQPDDYDEDDDGDGLTDVWEDANGFDSLDATDAAGDADGDGRTALDEFVGGTDPTVDDSPSEPTPISPPDGTNVDTATPELVVDNAVSPVGTPLTYLYEVYDDDSMTTLLASSASVSEAVDETAWVVDVALGEDTTFWWRAGADDGFITVFSSMSSFFVDVTGDAPSTPVPIYPLTGAVMSADSRVIEWEDSDSPQGQALTYVVVLEDDTGTDVLPSGAGTVAGSETEATEELVLDASWVTPGEEYRWQVVAMDQTGRESGASPWQDFGYQTTNTPPEPPVFQTPVNGVQIEETSPVVILEESVDAQGGLISYVLLIDTDVNFADPDILEADGDGSGTVSFDLAAEGIVLTEGEWSFRARASDVNGATSDPSTITIFVRGENDAPPTPRLDTPADDFVVDGGTVEFVVDAVVDPEGDAITYEIWLGIDRSMDDPDATGGSADTNVVNVSIEGLAGGYWWTARAVDDQGAASGWASPRYLVVLDPEWGTCSASGSAGPSSVWLLTLLGAGLVRRRRRSVE